MTQYAIPADRVVITVAQTGAITNKALNPNVPERPAEIAQPAYQCFTGRDLSARNLQDLEFFAPPLNLHPEPLFSLVQRGRLGIKTGRGFFDYRDRDQSEVLRQRDRYLLRIMKSLDFCIKKQRLV